MAPGYRNTTQSRRTARGQIDHDIFEGLPVRNWRRDIVTVAPPPALDLSQPKDKWDVELPWGMPKDSHLMPQHSQDLLRAARSGRIYQKRRLEEEDEGEDRDRDGLVEKPLEKKDEAGTKEGDGFTVKTWKLVPKHMEGPEIEYLAKRRKGLRGTAVKPAAGPTLTKMTVRKTDDSGNSFIEHVVVPEGVSVEGEVIAQSVVADPAAIIGDAAQPAKRRPPPPKRKPKGPGRGRKKKVLAPTSAPAEGVATAATPATSDGTPASEGIKKESTQTPTAGEDVEMGEADGSQAASDDDGEEGSEDEEEGEIVESPTPGNVDAENAAAEAAAHAEREKLIAANTSTPMVHKLPPKPTFSSFSDSPAPAPAPVPVPVPAAVPGPRFEFSGHKGHARDLSGAGSPLKNELAPRSYSPSVRNDEDEAEGDDDDAPPQASDKPAEKAPSLPPQGELQHHPEILPNSDVAIPEAVKAASEAADTPGAFASLLDGMTPGAGSTSDMLLDADTTTDSPAKMESDTLPTALPTSDAVEQAAEPGSAPEQKEEDKQDTVAGTEAAVVTDDAFEDLLGGLEENLNEHEAAATKSLLSRENSVPEPVETKKDETEPEKEVKEESAAAEPVAGDVPEKVAEIEAFVEKKDETVQAEESTKSPAVEDEK